MYGGICVLRPGNNFVELVFSLTFMWVLEIKFKSSGFHYGMAIAIAAAPSCWLQSVPTPGTID